MTTEPERSLEIEQKYDVDADTPLPEWTRIPGVAAVDGPEQREHDAIYYDTDGFDLARASVALRRREGGIDAGWHIKGPVHYGARTELHWPLSEEVPTGLLAVIDDWTHDELLPLARIRNTRMAYRLLDAEGGFVAEFVDDVVSARDLRKEVDRAWREWEVELGPSAPADHDAFFAAVTDAVVAVGGRRASSSSKIARAIGYEAPDA